MGNVGNFQSYLGMFNSGLVPAPPHHSLVLYDMSEGFRAYKSDGSIMHVCRCLGRSGHRLLEIFIKDSDSSPLRMFCLFLVYEPIHCGTSILATPPSTYV